MCYRSQIYIFPGYFVGQVVILGKSEVKFSTSLIVQGVIIMAGQEYGQNHYVKNKVG